MPQQLQVGFEDEHLIVAWKPHGVLTSGNSGRTFVREVNRLVPNLPESGVLPCHRLDFGTSGWVVFGKHKEAARQMGLLFESRRITKQYVALVHGNAPTAMKLAWPVDGKSAETCVSLLAKGSIAGGGPVSFIHVEPITGRMHQIRRHLHQAGHGVVGDDRYGIPGKHYRGKGLFLSAYGLAFGHPFNPEEVALQAPPSKKFRKLPFVHQSDFIQRFSLSSHV
jgi:23S rRNA-/tRNA-specific pseudouridylate synthase